MSLSSTTPCRLLIQSGVLINLRNARNSQSGCELPLGRLVQILVLCLIEGLDRQVWLENQLHVFVLHIALLFKLLMVHLHGPLIDKICLKCWLHLLPIPPDLLS